MSPKNSNSAPAPEPVYEEADGPSVSEVPRADRTRPLTINLDETLLRRLKIVGVLRDKSLSTLVEEYVSRQVERDLKKLVPRLGIEG